MGFIKDGKRRNIGFYYEGVQDGHEEISDVIFSTNSYFERVIYS